MPKFVIERNVPGAGAMTPQQLHDIAAKSNGVLHDMQRNGTPVQWDHSYVSGEVLHCVYVAPDEATIREHARCGGFPVEQIFEVRTMIGPTTGE
ncbi:MAG: DUF4242 domain-containing protein [Thermomicrobiales bacterium]